MTVCGHVAYYKGMAKAEKKKKPTRKTVQEAISKYKANPTEENLKGIVKELKSLAEYNPAHLEGGYYKTTKDEISRSAEMYDRGNKVRGVLGYASVPYKAAIDTIRAPFTALSRAISDRTNVSFDDPDSLAERDPGDVEYNVRAAKELSELLSKNRPDPTSQMERVVYTKEQFGPNKERAIADAAIRTAASAAMLNPLGIPFVSEGVSDVLSAPHTQIMNSHGWNGKSREEYEEEKRKEKELSKKACTVLDLMRLVR